MWFVEPLAQAWPTAQEGRVHKRLDYIHRWKRMDTTRTRRRSRVPPVQTEADEDEVAVVETKDGVDSLANGWRRGTRYWTYEYAKRESVDSIEEMFFCPRTRKYLVYLPRKGRFLDSSEHDNVVPDGLSLAASLRFVELMWRLAR